ncbi:Suppressor of the cold-sensitive snRNP bioproteinsis mutant brr1-1 [Perkinsus chesapeaki]|uniref:subtilisin n=1 Tax=Perkinsus chesapeaki TaxID=330153 RepID=A0A7J6L7L6_PERCH|nr:Suppressor of the cold-sensitive snRNP bioproteinsis mutant brr1-1 [Perkinsus chesapeaki]
MSDGSLVDIRRLPSLLDDMSSSADDNMRSFLKSVKVSTLTNANIQIVHTSPDTIESHTLCAFAEDAAKVIPKLDVKCGGNAFAEVQQLDPSLHVNDPGATTQDHFKRMRMGEVWDLLSRYSLRTVSVAILDTGVNFTDPDLAPLEGIFRKSSGGIFYGAWNFVNKTSKQNITHQHGTSIARLMAAKGNNSYGMVGMAPNVKLASMQVLDGNGRGNVADICEGIDMAIDIGVDIISASIRTEFQYMSVASRDLYRRTLDAAERKGIIVVSGSGNEGKDAYECYPCSHGGPYGICVGALNDNDTYTLARWSNYGSVVDIAAFGLWIQVGLDNEGSPIHYYGTSFATPMVTGTVAMLMGLGIDKQWIKRLLLHYALPIDTQGHPIRPRGGALDVLGTIQGAISRFRISPKNIRGRL